MAVIQPFDKLEMILNYIEENAGKSEILFIPISDSLQDSRGNNMAIITEKILTKDLRPNGFIKKERFRIYEYVSTNNVQLKNKT